MATSEKVALTQTYKDFEKGDRVKIISGGLTGYFGEVACVMPPKGNLFQPNGQVFVDIKGTAYPVPPTQLEKVLTQKP